MISLKKYLRTIFSHMVSFTVTWEDLDPKPTTTRRASTRKKTFETHVLTSAENQQIIKKSAKESERKDKIKKEKEDFVKTARKQYNTQKRKAKAKSVKAIKLNPKL